MMAYTGRPESGTFFRLQVYKQGHPTRIKPLDIALLNVFQYLNGRYGHIFIP